MVDRLVYGNHDPLIVFAVAAAVTSRIRLMPTVLLLSLCNAAIVAKQAASIDAVSGGRFSLGVGVGSRADDFAAGAAGAGVSNQSKEVIGYYRAVEAAWKDAGKPGRPRLVVAPSCAVGAYAAERTRESMRSYYAFRGEAAGHMDLSVPSTPQAILDAIGVFEDIGADELILEPGHADLDQVDRLTGVVASR